MAKGYNKTATKKTSKMKQPKKLKGTRSGQVERAYC